MRAFMYGNQILVFNSLFAVRQRQEFHIHTFQLLAGQLVAKLTVARFQRVTMKIDESVRELIVDAIT